MKKLLSIFLIISLTLNIIFIVFFNSTSNQIEQINNINILENNEKNTYAQSNNQYMERESLFSNFYFYPTDIVFLGDSITQKFEWQDVFPNKSVKNRGIGSDTTLGALSRIDSIVATKPKNIVIMLGINDLSLKRTVDEIAATYKQLICKIKSELLETTVVVNSVLPVTSPEMIKNEDIILLNLKINEICNEQNIKYIDLFSNFVNEDGNLKDEYNYDGVHLNADGYRVLINILKDKI